MVTTLSERLKEKSAGLHNPEPEWVQFIKDHRRYIVEHSTTWYINPDVMGRYRYRLEEYLEFIKQPVPYWLVIYINELQSNIDFTDMDYILIPDASYLDKLRKNYNTFISNYRK